MSSTVCTTSEFMPRAPPVDFAQTSNRAGAPLPLIPRRSSSSSSRPKHVPTQSTNRSTVSPPTHTPTNFIVQPPTPPGKSKQPASNSSELVQAKTDDAETSSSSVSDGTRPTIAPRAKRVRGYKMLAMCPPENSTPTPAVFKAKGDPSSRNHLHVATGSPEQTVSLATDDASDDETPRAPSHQKSGTSKRNILRLNLSPTQPRPASESYIDFKPKQFSAESRNPPAKVPIELPPAIEGKLLRNKSGEPIKSSLKSSKRPDRGSLSVIIGPSSSKSEPSTPTHSKAVHFDQQLEYVKLFLAEQKPLAVSRDGSPTDTSGTESEFPSFIYGNREKEGLKGDLVMQVTNMPTVVKTQADVALEELKLSGDMSFILGQIKVRNFAFEKWLAVRFTFDSWQTTSEVTAKYVQPLENGSFDRFSFSIRLNDIKNRIDEKTLLLAIRYKVAGMEIWDNNGAQNYRAVFSRAKIRQDTTKETTSGNVVSDLRTRLEQVAKGRDGADFFTTPISRRSVSASDGAYPPPLKADGSLASRYDFSASWRSPWKAQLPAPPQHNRTNTHPSNSVPWPQKLAMPATRDTHSLSPIFKKQFIPPGSPRDVDEMDISPIPYIDHDPLDLPFPVPARSRSTRNHQRGYFGLSPPGSSGVKRTSPGTPILGNKADDTLPKPQTANRLHSFPPSKTTRLTSAKDGDTDSPAWFRLGHRNVSTDSSGGSEASTPSITSSSASPSPSPTESPMMASPSPDSHIDDYSQFLNRFCFYTGSDSLGVPVEIIPRSHSVSSVEDFLSTPKPSALSQESDRLFIHSRSPSFDDVLQMSGSSTPTMKGFALAGSRSPTPIAI